MSLLARVSTVGGLTLISRIFGFVRDILMTASLGAGLAADAFVIAFKLPNFFRRLFAEGAFSAGFVPLYAKILGDPAHSEERAAAAARDFAENVLAWFLPILLIFLLLMELAMVPIIQGLTGDDVGAVKFDLTVDLARLTFPYLTLISLVSLLAGVLGAHGRYAGAAFVPVLLNITMIMAMLLAPADDMAVARLLALAVSLSGLLQLLWLVVNMRRAGLSLRLRLPRRSALVARMMALIAPVAFGAGITQINLLADIFLAANYLETGAVSWLFYGDRINQLTVGVVGVAIGTVLLPTISKLISAGDDAAANATQNTAIGFALVITLPAAVALVIIPHDIIATLFERGAFGPDTTRVTAAALAAYASGLPAYVLVKVLSPGFFAREDTQTPVRLAMIALLINLGVNIALIGPLGHVGLAVGTSVAAWANALALTLVLIRRGQLHIAAATWALSLKSALAALVMGLCLWFLADYWPLYDTAGMMRAGRLGLLVLAGSGAYAALMLITGAISIADVKKALRRNSAL